MCVRAGGRCFGFIKDRQRRLSDKMVPKQRPKGSKGVNQEIVQQKDALSQVNTRGETVPHGACPGATGGHCREEGAKAWGQPVTPERPLEPYEVRLCGLLPGERKPSENPERGVT